MKPDNPPLSDITLRDLFAAFALAGLCGDHISIGKLSVMMDAKQCASVADGAAKFAYGMADALLSERSK